MQNYEQIFKELGIEIPEDKKDDLKKKMFENYKTVVEYNKKVEKIHEEIEQYKNSIEDGQKRLKEFENEDSTELKEQVETLTRQLEEEKEARASENRRFENKEAVKKFLSGKKFVNALTEDAIRNGMLAKLEAEKGKNAEEVFKELTTKDGKEIENILVVENKEPERKVPCFVSLKEKPEREKGVDKLKAMPLDERISLRRNNPSQYMDMLNDK